MAKKKTTRRRGTASGVESNRQRQERLEERRRERERAAQARKRADQRRSLMRAAFFAAVVVAVGAFFYLRGGAPTSIEGHDILSFSSAGEGLHTPGSVAYETSPPVSGEHSPSVAPCGVHGEPIENEVQVHNLEHGAVGIQFQPDLDPTQIEQIEDLVRGYESHVFSAPYEDMEPNITVTSWSRKMELDTFDRGAIRTYVEEFRQSGPERQTCDATQDEAFEPAPAEEER
jgi:Spy/CpxP family protein refolding chaperone